MNAARALVPTPYSACACVNPSNTSCSNSPWCEKDEAGQIVLGCLRSLLIRIHVQDICGVGGVCLREVLEH